MQNTLGLTILKKIEKSQMRVHKDVGLIVICLYVFENQLNTTLKTHRYKFQIQKRWQNSNI